MNLVMLIRVCFALVLSFLFTYYLIPICKKIAFDFGILDIPNGTIKTHKKPTPYLGGIAVYVGFIAALALVLPFENDIVSLLLGSTLLLFIGFIDDLIVTKPYQKWCGQCIAALCFLKAGLYLKESFFLAYLWNIPISFLWILTVINAFNLVDVMDGLAVCIAICATSSFLIMSIIFKQIGISILLAAFLGALLGFVRFNKPPASIYLGDAGSLFIGGFLATVPFLFKWGVYSWYGFLTPIVILAVPLIEVSSLVVIRTYKGIPFYNASPDHFSIYLRNNGWSCQEILLFTTFFCLLLLAIAIGVVLNYISLFYLILTSIALMAICSSALLFGKKSFG